MGGALDAINENKSDPVYYLGIVRVTESGSSSTNQSFLIKVEGKMREIDPNYIDHMFLEDKDFAG